MTDSLQGCSDDFPDIYTHEVWFQLMAAAGYGVAMASESTEGKEDEAKIIEATWLKLLKDGPNNCWEMFELILQLEPHLGARFNHSARQLKHEPN